jgi:anti-sigma B factor antagonist
MALKLDMHSVKDVSVLRVAGRIVLGDDLTLLEQKVTSALKDSSELIIDLSAVDYVDSSGLGALVRHVTAARARRKKISLCGLTPNVRKLLDITRVIDLFQTYANEEEALAARGSNLATPTHPGASTSQSSTPSSLSAPISSSPPATRILCVDSSLEMLSQLRGIFQAQGYQVLSASNFPDAQLLVKSASVLVVGPNPVPTTEASSESSVDVLRNLAPKLQVINVTEPTDTAKITREVITAVKTALADSPSAQPS